MNPLYEIIQEQNRKNATKRIFDRCDCVRKCADMFEVIYKCSPEYQHIVLFQKQIQQNFFKPIYEFANDLKRCNEAIEALNKLLPEERQTALEFGFLLFFCRNVVPYCHDYV